MKYKDVGFRAIYKNFCAFPLGDRIREIMSDYPNIKNANCILTYGYIDREAGLTLEVLAAGFQKGEGFEFFEPCKETRFFVRIGAVENEDFAYFGRENAELNKRYAHILEMLKGYDVGEDIEETRTMGFLDSSRHPHYPDDVRVFITKKGLNAEVCWVRISGFGEHQINGILLNEPIQDFGCHPGDEIGFFVQEGEDGEIILYTNVSSRKNGADQA